MPSLAQRAMSEFLGTAFLLAAVVGSGIMAQRLAGGNVALALLCNTLATGAILPVIILMFGSVSGAHFNPAVSVAFALRGELSWQIAFLYVAVQAIAAVVGVWVAHLMFDLPVWQISSTVRSGSGQWLAEAVATFGLLLTIFCHPLCSRPLHYGGLLVHRIDLFRQSSGNNRALAFGYVRRNCAFRGAGIYCGSVRGHDRRGCRRADALAGLAGGDGLAQCEDFLIALGERSLESSDVLEQACGGQAKKIESEFGVLIVQLLDPVVPDFQH